MVKYFKVMSTVVKMTLIIFLSAVSGLAAKEKKGQLSVGAEIGEYEQTMLRGMTSPGVVVESHIGRRGESNLTKVTRRYYIVKSGVHFQVETTSHGVITKISWSKDSDNRDDFKGQPWIESQAVEFSEKSFRDVSRK